MPSSTVYRVCKYKRDRAPITIAQGELDALLVNAGREGARQYQESLYSCDLSWLSNENIEKIISGFGPEEEMKYGKKYLVEMLHQYNGQGEMGAIRGRKELQKFAETALRALSEDGSLDLERNFTESQKKLFVRKLPSGMNRRYFMTGLTAFCGVGLGMDGAFNLAEKALDFEAPPLEVPQADAPLKVQFQYAKDVFHREISPWVELGIGVVVANDAKKEFIRMRTEDIAKKLEHIADAVDELSNQVRKPEGKFASKALKVGKPNFRY